MHVLRLSSVGVLLLAVELAMPVYAAGPHEFSGNAAYPNLAALAMGFCNGCHSRRGSDFGNDFLDGIAVVTDLDYRVVRDDGSTAGPRRNPSLPSAMKCLGCHDGVLHTPTGIDYMPNPDPWNMSLNLDWGAGGAHNIWGMGQDSAYHPVEIHYPPDPDEQVWPGFRTLIINRDNNRVLVNGIWTIVDPTLSPKGLPLVTDPADPSKGYISCTTCHNGHDRSGSGSDDFLRADWPNLCFLCHRPESAGAVTVSAGGTTVSKFRNDRPSVVTAIGQSLGASDRAAWKSYFWKLSRREGGRSTPLRRPRLMRTFGARSAEF